MMRKDYEKLFTHLEPPEPPEDLLNRIMKRIHREQRTRALKWRFGFFVLLLAGSAVAAVPAFRSVQASLVESGFTDFVSLAFADTGAVMAYWDSFTAALLESLPIMSIAVFLAVIFAFLESLKYVARDFKVVFLPLKAN
jgi:ABC-type phosphate/phosphonate transport system permease subunit